MKGVLELSESLRHENNKLTWLSLQSELYVWFEKFIFCVRILTMNVPDEKVGIDGVMALAETLQNPNCKLKYLDLQCSFVLEMSSFVLAGINLSFSVTDSFQKESREVSILAEGLMHPNCQLIELLVGGKFENMPPF